MFSLSRNEFLRETSIIFHITRSHARNKFLCVALLIEPFARVARLLVSIPQAEPIFDSLQAKNQILVRVRGIEPLSRVWKTRILTVVLHPHGSRDKPRFFSTRRQNGSHFVGLLFSYNHKCTVFNRQRLRPLPMFFLLNSQTVDFASWFGILLRQQG